MKNAAIYAASRKILTVSAIRKIPEVTDVCCDAFFVKNATQFQITLSDVTFSLNIMPKKILSKHRGEFQGFVKSIHEKTPIVDMLDIMIYIGNFNQAYGLVSEIEFDFESPLWLVLVKLAKIIDGVIFVSDTLLDSHEQVLFGSLSASDCSRFSNKINK